MWADSRWRDRAMHALQETLNVDAGLKREMIEFLFEEKFWDRATLSWAAAVTRFNDCLSIKKPSFFKLGEVWALMSRFRRHQLFLAMAEDLGYEVREKPTEERQQALLLQLLNATKCCERQLEENRSMLDRLLPARALTTDRIEGEGAEGGVGF